MPDARPATAEKPDRSARRAGRREKPPRPPCRTSLWSAGHHAPPPRTHEEAVRLLAQAERSAGVSGQERHRGQPKMHITSVDHEPPSAGRWHRIAEAVHSARVGRAGKAGARSWMPTIPSQGNSTARKLTAFSPKQRPPRASRGRARREERHHGLRDEEQQAGEAGPMARAELNRSEFSPTALMRSSFGTRSGTNASRAGRSMACTIPLRTMKREHQPGPRSPPTRTVSTIALTRNAVCVVKMSLRFG